MPVLDRHVTLHLGHMAICTQQVMALLGLLLTHVTALRWYYLADKLGMLVWQDMPAMKDKTCAPAPRMHWATLRRAMRERVWLLQRKASPHMVLAEGQGA